MYIVTCVYNTLSKSVRSIIDEMKTVEMKFMGGLTACVIGFSLLVAALVYKDDLRGLIHKAMQKKREGIRNYSQNLEDLEEI